MRALEYAREKKHRDKEAWTESVVGAAIDLGLCLDLATEAGVVVVKEAFALYQDSMREVGAQLPSNRGGPDRLVRQLDCAVMRHAHSIRRRAALEPIDTVRGIFVEGGPAYPGSGFHEKTHVQICVCNPAVIKGVFRVLDLLPP